MSPAEVAWRARSALRDAGDLLRLRAGHVPARHLLSDGSTFASFTPGFCVLPSRTGYREQLLARLDPAARARLQEKADTVCANRLSFFDLDAQFLGDPVDWHADHSAGKRQEPRPIQLTDYRDFDRVGDCKLVWEPNRHHQLVVLAQAALVTGEPRYAAKALELLESWLDQNPFGYGMNWKSPLELGIRLINWVWTLDLLRLAGAQPGDALWRRVRHAAYLMCREIARKYSRGSSSNNHLIGEAAGVFVAASYFPDFPRAAALRDQALAILETEILAQSYPDGCTREQASGYQLFVLQFFTICMLVAERTGQRVSRAWRERLHQQYRFVKALAEGGPELPWFGDKDDGYVLDFGEPVSDSDMTVATDACLFGDPDLAAGVRRWPGSLAWLFDGATVEPLRPAAAPEAPPLRSRAFRDSGWYLLQSGTRDGADALSVLFDCGELGFGAIAAHGHADALSFTLRAAGKPIFVDAGTYDYFTYPEARDYFRSTRAHNTVEIDGRSQSEASGPFMWARRAEARCLEFLPDAPAPSVRGMHDGYAHLEDPVGVQRSITLDTAARTVRIRDGFTAGARHTAKVCFHLDGDVRVQQVDDHCFALEHTGTRLELRLDPRLAVTCCRAREGQLEGWISKRYHVLTPSVTLVGELELDAPLDLEHEIRLLPQA